MEALTFFTSLKFIKKHVIPCYFEVEILKPDPRPNSNVRFVSESF